MKMISVKEEAALVDARKAAAILGAEAAWPWQLPWPAWRAIFRRVWDNSTRHDIGMLSAAVGFYAFLSFVPLLGALVMSYGLIADPAIVGKHLRLMVDLVPADAARLIYGQLTSLTEAAAGKKGFALAAALAVSIYGASRASNALIGSLNVIYEQRVRRGFFRRLLVAAALSASAVLVGVAGIAAASMLSLAQELVTWTGPAGAFLIQALTWIGAATFCSISIGAMYRFAPNRANARWQWLAVGSMAATLLWLLATLGFGLYASRFGDYDATYGSLGAVVVLLMWLYVSAYAVLLGALINAEAERQTARDTTTGPERPMGERGASMADTSAARHAAFALKV